MNILTISTGTIVLAMLLLRSPMEASAQFSTSGVRTDEGWSTAFAHPVVGGDIEVMASDGNRVYIAGDFEVNDFFGEGYTGTASLFVWDEAQWYLVSEYELGFGETIEALAVNGDRLYIGGRFRDAGGVAGADNVAVWDGDEWSALGSGLDGTVNTIALMGDDVFVGGEFENASGIEEADYLARWDGEDWHAVVAGLGMPVRALTVSGATLTIGLGGSGVFADGYVAQWDTSGAAVAAQLMGGYVNAVAIYDQAIYAAGRFDDVGGDPDADGIVSWDGEQWVPVGNGIPLESIGDVEVLAVFDGDLYVGGDFHDAGGVPGADFLARWDGEAWHTSGLPVDSEVRAMEVFGDVLWVSIRPSTIAGGSSLVGWDGQDMKLWGKGLVPESGFPQGVRALAVSENGLYVGGTFREPHSGGSYLVHWGGSTWIAPSTGPDEAVNAITTSGTDIYIGGEFEIPGVPNTQNMARWNGERWLPLGSGGGNRVFAMAAVGNDVYVGGDHRDGLGGNPDADYIARWDGVQWHALGEGVNREVYAIASIGSDVYIGGRFEEAGRIDAANFVARWDGEQWHALGAGLRGEVYAIAVDGNDVYVGGEFVDAGGNPDADYIARWDGTEWHSLGAPGEGPNSTVRAIAVRDGIVYAGGEFFEPPFTAGANRVARWDGEQWSPLGNGLDADVLAIAIVGAEVYVGGVFRSTSDLSLNSSLIASYYDPLLAVSTEKPAAEDFRLSGPYPNPVRDRATFVLQSPQGQHIEAVVYDVLGRRSAVLHSGATSPNSRLELHWDAGHLAPGLYVLQIMGKHLRFTRPIVVAR